MAFRHLSQRVDVRHTSTVSKHLTTKESIHSPNTWLLFNYWLFALGPTWSMKSWGCDLLMCQSLFSSRKVRRHLLSVSPMSTYLFQSNTLSFFFFFFFISRWRTMEYTDKETSRIIKNLQTSSKIKLCYQTVISVFFLLNGVIISVKKWFYENSFLLLSSSCFQTFSDISIDCYVPF